MQLRQLSELFAFLYSAKTITVQHHGVYYIPRSFRRPDHHTNLTPTLPEIIRPHCQISRLYSAVKAVLLLARKTENRLLPLLTGKELDVNLQQLGFTK